VWVPARKRKKGEKEGKNAHKLEVFFRPRSDLTQINKEKKPAGGKKEKGGKCGEKEGGESFC